MVTVTSTTLYTYSYIDDSYEFTIKLNGTAQDISGWTVYFTVKDNRENTTALISKTITSHTDAANGVTTVTIDKADTEDLSGTYYYDLKVDNAAGKRKIYAEGEFVVSPGVKRD